MDADAEGEVAVVLRGRCRPRRGRRTSPDRGCRPGTSAAPCRPASSGSRRTRCRRRPRGPSSPGRRRAGTPRRPSGSRSGRRRSRRRSSGWVARCHRPAPIALHVVSMPASSSRKQVPRMWCCVERRAVDARPRARNEMRSSGRSLGGHSRRRRRPARGSSRAPRGCASADLAVLEPSCRTRTAQSVKRASSASGMPEHRGDHPHRDVLGVVDGGVGGPSCPANCVDQLVGDAPG